METAKNKPSVTAEPAEKCLINQPATYTVDGRRFVVTSVFPETGGETFGTILMRLLKSEVAYQ